MKTHSRQSTVRVSRSIARDTAALTNGHAHTAAPGKKRGPKPKTPVVDTERAEVKLSARVGRLIESVRASFKAYVAETAAFLRSRAELCNPFMKAFLAYKEETGLTMADFVRQFDASVPLDRKGYRSHKAMQAADYLARLYRQQNRVKEPAGEGTAAASKPATPLDGMARLIASMLPLIGADQVSKLWETLERELHWTDRQRASLENRVKEADPLLNVRPPRGAGGSIPQLRIATSRRTADEGEEEQPRTGTHG